MGGAAVPETRRIDLSRRERQIMDVIYRRGRASVAEVVADIPDPPSYSAVRALLRILEDKGHLKHIQDGPRYVYLPARPRRRAGRAALKRVLQTFYDGSVEKAVAALLDASSPKLSPEEMARLARLVERARKEGR
jgi:predicted transcriptional regulator